MNAIDNKLWVFQANRSLTNEEEQDISNYLTDFLQSWAAHGAELNSALNILEHKFIIISVDEEITKATGCSIDSLNQCIRQIDAKYNLDLLNRLLISYEVQPNEIKTVPLVEFKKIVKSSQLSLNTIIYNLSVSTPTEFKEKFKQPLKESWANIYLS